MRIIGGVLTMNTVLRILYVILLALIIIAMPFRCCFDHEFLDSKYFSRTGINAHTISPNPSLEAPASKESVKITNPPTGITKNAGDVVSIAVEGTDNIRIIQLTAGNPDIEIFSGVQNSSSAVFNYMIPIEAAGVVNIAAIGFGEAGFSGMDSIYINVVVDANLDSIKVYPEMIYMGKTETTLLSVTGYYDDGVIRKLDHHPEVSYSCADTNIALFIEPGMVKGIERGMTIAIVSFQGDTVMVDLEVLP